MQPPPADAEVRALAQVTIADVAEQAGMTRGSVYHLWPTQEAYRFDLMRSLGDPDPSAAAADDDRSVRAETARAVRRAVGDVTFRARLSFQPYTRSAAAAGVMSEQIDAMVDDLLDAIRTELRGSGLQLRAEFGEDHLRASVGGIVQGLAVLGLMHDGSGTGPDVEQLVTSAQESVEALLGHFTEPVR